MRPHFLATATVKLLILALLWGSPGSAAAQITDPPPRQGVILVRPSLAQLRTLMGRVVRITLNDGKQIQARILSAWPGVLRVTFADGRAGAVARHRIRSVTHLGSRFASLATQDAADAGKLFAHLGLGLTLGGLLLGGAAGPALFVAGDRYSCPGILDCVPPATTAAIFITALSASAVAAGVPLWIVGAVRKQVHGRTGPAADRARRRFRGWGMGLTFTGIGVSAVGGALLAASAWSPDRLDALRWAGAIIAPLGAFVALCIGLPMWVEAVRKGTADVGQPKAQAAPARRVFTDPHHRRAWNARHSTTLPTATFAYGWQF
jgi:hypothetical protein